MNGAFDRAQGGTEGIRLTLDPSPHDVAREGMTSNLTLPLRGFPLREQRGMNWISRYVRSDMFLRNEAILW